ncbi:uncharacterized protein LOC127805949 [Diospyros lotus]|uniref:uncharacterized protein LOC127805949 n=1 Tax=Diospyros lotus TaxID=55363 RepID=UPI002253270C|nr:uncharacterized protein LOC127805949 [Diospyros lotus]
MKIMLKVPLMPNSKARNLLQGMIVRQSKIRGAREKKEYQGGENFLLAVSAKRPIMLRKIASTKTSNSTIVIIVIKMVILKSFVVPSKTNHPNSPHSKLIMQMIKNINSWLIDSGCTTHMAKNISLFSQIDNSIRTKVVLGHGETILAEGKGNVIMHTKQGEKKISNVLFVLRLSQNLLSIAQLMHSKFSVIFKDGICTIYDPQGVEIARVNMVDNAFFLNGEKLSNPTSFRSLVGSLLYLTASKPDLMFAASMLSRYMNSLDFGIWFESIGDLKLIGYADSDWASCVDYSKSSSSYIFSLGTGVFSWNSKKQEVVVQSIVEVEYISAAGAANQAIWLRKLLSDLGYEQNEPTELFSDNKSAIAIASNPVQHGKTKHIKVKFHLLREAEKEGKIKLTHCNSEFQLADIITKALPCGQFEFLRNKLGLTKKNLKEEC